MKSVIFGSLMFLAACDNTRSTYATRSARYFIEQDGFPQTFTTDSVAFYTSHIKFVDNKTGRQMTLYGTIRIVNMEAQP